jgi:hypothetical protein
MVVAKRIKLVCGNDVCSWNDLHICHRAILKYLGDFAFGSGLDGINLVRLAESLWPLVGLSGPKCFQLRYFFETDPSAYNLWTLVVLVQ